LVDKLNPEKIEKFTSKGFLYFNITKAAKQRKSGCYVNFEKSDLIPLFKGLAAWEAPEIDWNLKIQTILNKGVSDSEKLKEIKKLFLTLDTHIDFIGRFMLTMQSSGLAKLSRILLPQNTCHFC